MRPKAPSAPAEDAVEGPIRRVPMARYALLALLLVLISIAVHGRARGHDTLFEGDVIFTENPALSGGWSGADSLTEPGLPNTYGGDTPAARFLSVAIVELFGPGPQPQHLASVGLHLLNVLLVLLLLARMGVGNGVAFLVAFVFALHPIVVEPTDWIAQRARLLAVSMALASAWVYEGYRARPHVQTLGAALLLFFGALGTHPFVAALPLALLARKDSRLRPLLPFFAAAAVVFAVTWLLAPATELSPVERLLASPLAVGHLAVRLVLPTSLAYHYPHPSLDASLPILRTIVTTLVLAWLTLQSLRKRDSWIAWGWLWFVSTAFLSVLLPYGTALGGDRDVYLACIGFFLAIAVAARDTLFAKPQAKALAPLAAGVVVLLLTTLTMGQSLAWRDSTTLNESALAATGPNAVAHRNLARHLLWRGKLTAAHDQLELAHALRPDDAITAKLQGDVALRRARHGAASRRPDREARMLQDAERIYRRASELAPGHDEPHLRLGEVYQRRGDEASLREAERELAAAIEIWPARLESHQRLGLVQLGLFELGPARTTLERVVELAPDSAPDGWCGLGLVAMQEGNHEEARRMFERTLEIEPDYVEALTNLGRLLLDAGEVETAETHLLRATRVHPRFSDALLYLGRAFEAQGRIPEAIEQFERTLEQEPTHVRANIGLAYLYAQEGRAEEASARARVVLERAPSPTRQAEALSILGRMALQTGDWEEARKSFTQALSLDTTRVDDEVNLGLALIQLDELAGARELFLGLKQRVPGLKGVEYGLGQVAERSGEYRAAAEHFRAGLQQQPRSWVLANALARVLASAPDDSLRNASEALELATRCVQTTQRRAFEALETLAAAQAESGLFAEAVATQREALALVPEDLRGPLRVRLALYEAQQPHRLGGDA